MDIDLKTIPRIDGSKAPPTPALLEMSLPPESHKPTFPPKVWQLLSVSGNTVIFSLTTDQVRAV